MRGPAACSAFTALVLTASAQPQLENPSFEAWDNAGQASQEPQQWSSIKTSDGGAFLNSLVPQLCWRSTDARTGLYSVNLRTVNSAVGAANGLLTNGRVHAELNVANSYMYTVQDNEQWRTAMTSRPDSLVGWFKAAPQTGDRANVGALLHVNDGRLPAFGTEGNYVAGASWKAPFGAVGQWTRFSAPFQYLNDWQPQWILLILTAGDSAGSQIGTQVWYDDLALVYNVQCAPSTPIAVLDGSGPSSLSVTYSSGGAPTVPRTFTAQLSDAEGSFANAQTIGSLTSSASSGTIACGIPDGLPPGSGYRIRVVADSPFYAPVGCPLAIEVQTSLGAREPGGARMEWRDDRLVVEAVRAGVLECFGEDGRLLLRADVREGSNTFRIGEQEGLLLVRLTDARGAWANRLAVLR